MNPVSQANQALMQPQSYPNQARQKMPGQYPEEESALSQEHTHQISIRAMTPTALLSCVQQAWTSIAWLTSMPVQDKSEQVDYLFKKALSTLGSLEIPNTPNLFLVYAHDNPNHGQADAETSKYLIQKLSEIRFNLYSDQTPMGQPYSSSPGNLKENGKLEDILTSQLCLLPTRLRDDVEPVDKVVVCCSEVLEKYLEWPHYREFYQQLQKAYCTDKVQSDTAAIREVVKAFLQGEEYKAGFHHVLTEMAFLQIRAEHLKDQHGIIPVSLTRNSSKQCLKDIILSTTVRIEDISRFAEQTETGQEAYPNQSRHLVLFKLIERLLVGCDEAKTFLDKFWQGYSNCIARLNNKQSTLNGLEFAKLVDGIFDEIRTKQYRDQTRNLSEHIKIVNNLRLLELSSIDLREALYKHYRLSDLSIQRVSGDKASLKDCYINLAIVESQAQREKDKKELKKQAATFERLPSSERLQATNQNKVIPLDQLFKTQKLRDGSEGVPKRILIQGRAGIGKTTLCKKLVYEYHQNGLWQDQFESILWVPLRQLKTHSPKCVEDLLRNQYFAGQGSRQALALAEVFCARQDKTLFILDGLDEVVGELNEGSPLKDFLQTLLTQAHVVVTSRPAGVDAHMLGHLDLELETVGFSPDNIQAYIQKFAPESNQAAIQQFINHTPLIQGLVNIPIQLDALCYSWDRLPQIKEVTMAMLYEAMVDKLWRKDGVRLEKQDKGKALASNVIQISSKAKLEKLMEDEIHYLGYLAFKGLEEGKIEFSLEELDQRQIELEDRFSGKELAFSFTTDLKKTSFLHTADVERPEAERHYHFLHLTFQEFFAAKFLVPHLQAYLEAAEIPTPVEVAQTGLGLMLDQEQLQTFIAQHKYNPRYEIVWWMVAGLLKGAALERFFALLGEEPRDLIGGRHQQVLMGCLNEGRTQLKGTIVLRLETELMQWFRFEIKLSDSSYRNYRNDLSELGRRRTFPEYLLLMCLDQPECKKADIIRTLGARPALSDNAISALIETLRDDYCSVRSAAASALGTQSTLPKAAISALIDALRDDSEYVRSAAAWTLGAQSTLPEATISALIDALRDDNEDVREAAANALGAQSTLSEAAIFALIDALWEDSEIVRDEAVDALGKQSMLPEAAIPALIDALRDDSEYVRSAAAGALDIQNTLPEAAISALIDALRDDNWSVRSAAAKALVAQKTLSEAVIFALIDVLRDDNMDVSFAAAMALGATDMLPEATIFALINALRDKDEYVRGAAIKALAAQGTLPEAAISALIDALREDNEDVSFAAARVLRAQNTLPEAAISALIDALRDDNKSVRSAAAKALGAQNMLPEAAISALIDVLRDDNKPVRSAAAHALGAQSTLSEAAIPVLIDALRDDSGEYVRSAAAWALGAQSTLPEATISALIDALRDDSEYVRSAAAWTLGAQSTLPEATISALIDAIREEHWEVRTAAAHTLGAQKTLPEAAISALIDALWEDDWPVKDEAARALAAQKTLSEAAISALIDALREDNEYRYAAADALGAQSTLSEAAISALIDALRDDSEYVRSAAARALGAQSTLPEAAISALIDALRDDNKYVRSAAARALGAQSTLPEAAISALIDALLDDNEDVREAAANALGAQNTLPEAAIPALISALRDDNKDVREAAANALGTQNTLPEAAISPLIDAIREDNLSVKDAAARAVAQNTLSEAAISALIDALRDDSEYVRSAAARALGEQNTLPETAIFALINALREDNWDVSSAAAKALGAQNMLPEAAISALIDALRKVKDAAVRALGLHFGQLYPALPSLKLEQIKLLYARVLFPHSCRHIAPLYIQGNRLHFYTEAGLGHSAPLAVEQIDFVIAAFKAAQTATPIEEERLARSLVFSEEDSNDELSSFAEESVEYSLKSLSRTQNGSAVTQWRRLLNLPNIVPMSTTREPYEIDLSYLTHSDTIIRLPVSIRHLSILASRKFDEVSSEEEDSAWVTTSEEESSAEESLDEMP